MKEVKLTYKYGRSKPSLGRATRPATKRSAQYPNGATALPVFHTQTSWYKPTTTS